MFSLPSNYFKYYWSQHCLYIIISSSFSFETFSFDANIKIAKDTESNRQSLPMLLNGFRLWLVPYKKILGYQTHLLLDILIIHLNAFPYTFTDNIRWWGRVECRQRICESWQRILKLFLYYFSCQTFPPVLWWVSP